MRACRAAGGEFIIANTSDDQIGLCKLGLNYVGAIDVLNRDAQIEVPLSLHYYKKGVQACSTQNLTIVNTLEGEEISVCLYSDDSVIDIETLASGYLSQRNAALNAFLGISLSP